jgi:putative membrane protein
MKPVAIILGLAGLAFATGLVAWQGAGAVVNATLAIGWGLLVVVAWEAVPLVLDAYAWRFLLPPEERPPVWVMVWARWIRKSASQLLPLMQIGGDMVGARMLYLRGVPGPLAGGAAVVDLTLAAVGQITFAMIGLFFLFDRDGSADLVVPLLVASLVLLFGVGCFIVVQHRGLFGFLANRSGKVSGGLVSFSGGAGHLDEAVREVYRRRGDIARNFAWQMGSWISSTGEVWIACWFLGYPVSVEEALIIQSLTRAVRAVAFMVPGGIGVQEGGLLVFASVLGLPMEIGLALALIKRVREIAVGVPGLIAWQVAETGRLLSNRTRV